MARLHWNLRLVAARAALTGLAAFAAVSGANAQWFPPVGAASPAEIADRLRAQGFVLMGPLRRNETVYLVDVAAGASGRERLVIDAWSGEILQRLIARPRTRSQGAAGGYVIERGEFDSPPPLGPPPARDFFFGSGAGGVAYGSPAVAPVEATPRTRVKQRPAAIRRGPDESKPTVTAAPPAQPATDSANPAAKDNSSRIAPPSAAAPTGAPSPGAQASQPGGPAKPEASPAESPPAASPSVAQTQAKGEPQPARNEPPSAAPPAPATKPSGKSKVNDVPVNPLE